jgi:pimeloyl-ACP methyl ester carboxylesterase
MFPMTAPLHIERIRGSGPTIVMLHGWGSSLEALKPLGHLLAPYGDIHLIDLPGFGQSPFPGAIWSSFDYADRLIAYLDENNIDDAIFLGHSFGGKVSLSLAARYPARVHKLILLAASGMKRKRSFWSRCRMQGIKWLGKTLKGIDSLCGTTLFVKQFTPKFGSADYKNAGLMRPVLVKSVNEDLSDLISTIVAPTLMLWGDNDTETPPEIAKRMHQLMHSSKLFIFPGKGHWLYQDVGYHLCAHYILPFLGRKDTSHA